MPIQNEPLGGIGEPDWHNATQAGDAAFPPEDNPLDDKVLGQWRYYSLIEKWVHLQDAFGNMQAQHEVSAKKNQMLHDALFVAHGPLMGNQGMVIGGGAGGGGIADEPAINITKPNPMWKQHFAAADKYDGFMKASYDDLYGKHAMKSTTKAKKPKKQWYDAFDAYPKDQSKTTPVKERICVVLGEVDKESIDNPDYWMWNNPYWVHVNAQYTFAEHMRYCSETCKWYHYKLVGGIYNGEMALESWLQENKYVKLDEPYINYWIKPDQVLEYYNSNMGDQIYKAPVQQATKYPVCEVIGRRYPNNQFVGVHMAEGKSKAMSIAGMNKLGNVYSCGYCGHHFQEPLIGVKTLEDGNEPHMVCDTCYSKHMEKKVIRAYNDDHCLDFMPDLIHARLKSKPTVTKNPRMFGVELEVGFNTGNRVANALDVWNTVGHDFCYIKHDGSITKEQFDDGYKVKNVMKMGFEVVSAPAGINVHRKRWQSLEHAKCFGMLRSWDADSCGFHVHVSKSALTWFQIGRLLVFMNHPNNRYFIEVVAGRSSNYYTRYIRKNFTDCTKIDESKYMALRTNKAHTIEFRIFRGTINYKHIIRNIEFVDALCDFCAPCVTSLSDIIDFRKFIKFVDANRHHYPLLALWLSQIDMVAKKKLADPKFVPPEEAVEVLSDAVKKQLKHALPATKTDAPLEKVFADCPPDPDQVVVKKKKPVNFAVMQEDAENDI